MTSEYTVVINGVEYVTCTRSPSGRSTAISRTVARYVREFYGNRTKLPLILEISWRRIKA